MHAIQSIIESLTGGKNMVRVLDVGCGDGFVSRALSRRADVQLVDSVDIHLTDRQVDALQMEDKKVVFHNNYSELPDRRYDLVLLLDVLEHVREDGNFLAEIADRYLSNAGYLIVTVPAFPFLFSRHDEFLAHFRRYTRKQLVGLVRDSNLFCIRSGYLFLSLLPIRLAEVLRERMTGGGREGPRGVGVWAAGDALTRAATAILRCDIRLSFFLNSFGMAIPGLTVWAACKKPA
jgi:SAM-dependent methyltransferase